LHESKLGSLFAEVAQPEQHDLVIVSGVGSVWPLLRSHSLLNNLQPVMGKTPLVMFYPGRYDGQSLRLFGKLKNNNYYRAFKLVP
jgi:bacteriophage exclusion system BrxB-like protein